MFMIRCILLLLTLTCNLTNNTNQNQLPFLTKNFNQRIKRFWSDKSSKSHSKKEKLLKNDRLFTDELLFTNYEGNQLRNLPKKQYTQQEVAEIQRILSKAEDDYYGILHIKKHATWDEILIAHRKLSLRVHPDKINAPGAKEATQRLNKARAELSKKFRNTNQNNNQQTTRIRTSFSPSFNQNHGQEVPDINDEPIWIATSSILPSKEKKQTFKTSSWHNKSSYLLFAFVPLIMGILIFIIHYKKQQRHSYSSNNENVSKRQNIHATYDSPEADDGSERIMHRDSVTSNA